MTHLERLKHKIKVAENASFLETKQASLDAISCAVTVIEDIEKRLSVIERCNG